MAVVQNYLPGDSHLIDKIVYELKSQGIFDQFRKECIADVDTKPAYQNLRQRVEGSVSGFLSKQKWKPDINKNQVREMLRKNIYESGFLETGVERIVDQVVNPKINSVFLPKVTEIVYKFLGIQRSSAIESKYDDMKASSYNSNSLMPTDLEAVSPESEPTDKKLDRSNDSQNLEDSKIDDDESPPFEPIEEQTTYLPMEENSIDSHLSGFSGLVSHDSNQSQDASGSNKPTQADVLNQDSLISKHSSDGHLSIVMSDDTDTKMEICEDSHQSKSSKTNDSSLKNFDFGHENSNRSSASAKIEKKSDKKNDNDKKSRSHDRHKSRHDSKSDSKDRKDDKSRKSERDKKMHSSKDCDKVKDGSERKDGRSNSKNEKDSKHEKEKDNKSDKDRDSKSDKDREFKSDKDKNGKDKIKHRHSSSSTKDRSRSRKESNSKDKDRNDSSSRDKSKSSSSRDSKSKGDSKNNSKHDSKSDKRKKDDKHHSKSDRHSSSSKNKDKDKKDSKKEKKENKDDHFSSKKRTDRRSTDRDSNDGQSGLKSSSSSFDSFFSSQTQSKSQESSTSNSNTGSGDSGTSDAVDGGEVMSVKGPVMLVNEDMENIDELFINTEAPRIKLIKPKFASNIYEARRLMKIRKKLSKIEKQNALEFLNNSVIIAKDEGEEQPGAAKNNLTDYKKNRDKNWLGEVKYRAKNDGKSNVLKKERRNVVKIGNVFETPAPNKIETEVKPPSPELKSSVVSAATWDALEAKLNQSIHYSTYYDIPDTPEKSSEQILNVNPNDCSYFEPNSSPDTKRYVEHIMNVTNLLEKEILESFVQEPATIQTVGLNKPDQEASQHDKLDTDNGRKPVTKKTVKRKSVECQSDTVNNNKKKRFNNHHIEVHENFSLPLSPAESDNSIDKKSDISEKSDKSLKKNEVEVSVKFKKNVVSKATAQRYSSEDLYKPRPFFSGSRRRTPRTLELD